MLGSSSAVSRKLCILCSAFLFTCHHSAEEVATADGSRDAAADEDPWLRLTTEEWQPGRVGAHNSTNPTKDLECVGAQTAMVSDPSLNWAMVKERLHGHLSEPLADPWLLHVCSEIQRHEPDTCVLGVTGTSAWLLPVTMPKFRNMARMLSSDQDFLVLNVTFYDTLRSGFPIFGVVDALSTPAYREWFTAGEESLQYFPARFKRPACEKPAAVALLEQVSTLRLQGVSDATISPKLALRLLADGGMMPQATPRQGCPLAAAAAFLVFALVRAETASVDDPGRASSLRDVIELVSRAEELVRDFSAEDEISFGELVASPWNLWWLLHRLQLALPLRLFPRGRGDGLVFAHVSKEEL